MSTRHTGLMHQYLTTPNRPILHLSHLSHLRDSPLPLLNYNSPALLPMSVESHHLKLLSLELSLPPLSLQTTNSPVSTTQTSMRAHSLSILLANAIIRHMNA